MAFDEESGVEKLKNKLYSRKADITPPDIRTPLEHTAPEVPPTWKKEEDDVPPPEVVKPSLAPRMPRKGISFAVKFFIGSFVFFLLAAGSAAFMFFGGGNLISPQNIDLQIVTPSLIDGGKPATFQIIITNRNQSELQLADLVIDYPDGTRSASDPTQSFMHERQSIGTINPGQQLKRTASAIFYGQEGAQEVVHATLQYNVPGSNAVFEKQTDATITLGSSPVSISVSGPSEAISGDQMSMDVTVSSNSTTPIQNLVLQAQYPFGFALNDSSPEADAGSALWRLGTLNPGGSKVIHLVGTIDGQEGDERIFRFLAGSNSDQTDTSVKVPFLTTPYTLTVHKPFISATLAVDGKTGQSIAATPGKNLQGTITWQNNLSDAVSDLELTLTLNGPAIDKSTISSPNGFYQSSNNTITWTKDQDPSLASVPPGGTETLNFSFASLPAAAGNVLITNPIMTLNLNVKGSRNGENNVPESISSAASMQVQLASAASIDAHALHFTGPFNNTGPMPPHAESATTYTVQWTVKNSSNALANAVATAVLPPYVTFIAAQPGTGITYNDASRTVTWPLGDVVAGVGYTLPARTGAFQVSMLPSTSQIGSSPNLISNTTLSGQDRFAQVQVTATADAPTINTSPESGFAPGMDMVGAKQ